MKTGIHSFLIGMGRVFLPKEEAERDFGGGQVTILQPYSLPGTVRSFAAKTEAGPEDTHPVDWITMLQPYGLPGGLRTFAAKAEASVGFAYSQCIIIG